MKRLLGRIYSLSGVVYVPKETLEDERLILHVSDTPSSLYGTLEKLIHKIQPTYIVHTGNFADNLLKSSTKHDQSTYLKSIQRLISIFENSSALEIYGVYGHLDNPELLNNNASRITWVEDYTDLTIDNIKLRISHYPRYALSSEADISLFGHNLDILSYVSQNATYLNGVESIHVIAPLSKHITHLDYPIGTQDTRQKAIQISI